MSRRWQRIRVTGVTAGTVCAAVVAAALPGAVGGAVTHAAESVTSEAAYDPAAEPATAEAEALSEADKSGQPVEVLSLRAEAREIFAMPEGHLEAREYAAPVWTRAAGEWQPVDLELAPRTDGSIGPKASTVELAFSGGGDSPLVSLVRHGRELELSWPGELPEPRLDGETAVYPEVLPGVDLRMEAVPDGFTSLLVVKSAEAAADESLQEVRLGLDAPGLQVKLTGEGGIEARDEGAGGVVFQAPTPLMWDSSAPVAASRETLNPGAPEVTSTEKEGRTEPGESGRVAKLGVDIPAGEGELVLTPDAEVLKGEQTEYPVFLDPQFHSPRASAWSMVSRHHASTSFWNFSGDEGVGYCVGWANCNSNELKRLFYRIDTSRFGGTRILSAEFVVRNVHSAQCTDHPVELWRTKGISSSTTWNSQTASGFWIERLRTASFNYGGNPQLGCKPAGDAEFNIRTAIQEAADKKWSTMTFGLKAGNETSNLHWKRFRYDAHLRVSYNRPPRQVSTSQLTMEYGGTCKPSATASHVRTLGQIHANNVTDPDGDNVRVQFRVRWGAEGAWNPALTTAKKSGSSFSITLPASVPQNTPLRWDVRAYDGTSYGPWSSSGSHACHFVYNTTTPQAPSIGSSHYPASDPSDPEDPWHDGVGQYGDFTLQAADTDVNRYRYGINGDPSPQNQITTTGGAPRTIKVLPEKPGLHFVTAQTVDQAGNVSEVTTHQFRVRAGQPERAIWTLNDAEGSSEAAGSSPARSLHLRGEAALGVAGHKGTTALYLNGTDAHALGESSIFDTRRGHTVSAWVKLDEVPDEAAIIVSQRGTELPDFELYYSAALDRWVFNHRTTDAVSTTKIIRAMSAQPGGVQAGVWTHLAGSYDGVEKQLRLFVNGELVGETSHNMTWTGSHGLQIGAGTYSGEVKSYFPGTIDEISLFDKRMWESQVQALYEEGVTGVPGRPVVAHFDFEEPAGSPEVLGYAHVRPAVLHGGMELGASGPVTTSARLSGEGAYGSVGVPHLNTERSFTVSAWAKIDPGQHTEEKVVVSQLGTHRPGFTLYYSGVQNRWVFGTYRSDAPDADLIWTGQPAGSAVQGEWVHLVGVHDTVAKTLSLYVNGRFVESVDWSGSWYADRQLQIGATARSGEVRRFFPGQISDVRLFERVVTEYEVGQLFQQSPIVKGRWQFEEGGSSTPDSSLEGNALDLHGGAGIGEYMGRVDLHALELDGSTGYAAAPTVPADTSASFTVAGWAQGVGALEEPASLVSASGVSESAFAVRYVPDPDDPGWGEWQVALPDQDTVGAQVTRVRSQTPHHAASWTHVAVVHDGFAKEILLYLNGQLEEVVCTDESEPDCAAGTSWAENVHTFQATHSLQVGRSRSAGAWGEHWPGAIDDLWFFQGALTSRQVDHLSKGFSDIPTTVP